MEQKIYDIKNEIEKNIKNIDIELENRFKKFKSDIKAKTEERLEDIEDFYKYRLIKYHKLDKQYKEEGRRAILDYKIILSHKKLRKNYKYIKKLIRKNNKFINITLLIFRKDLSITPTYDLDTIPFTFNYDTIVKIFYTIYHLYKGRKDSFGRLFSALCRHISKTKDSEKFEQRCKQLINIPIFFSRLIIHGSGYDQCFDDIITQILKKNSITIAQLFLEKYWDCKYSNLKYKLINISSSIELLVKNKKYREVNRILIKIYYFVKRYTNRDIDEFNDRIVNLMKIIFEHILRIFEHLSINYVSKFERLYHSIFHLYRITKYILESEKYSREHKMKTLELKLNIEKYYYTKSKTLFGFCIRNFHKNNLVPENIPRDIVKDFFID